MATPPTADVPQQRYQDVNGGYNISDADNGKLLECSGGNINLPASVSVGTYVYVRRTTSSDVRFVAGSGATLRSQGNLTTIAAQWVTVTVDKRSATEWVLSGSLA